MTKVKIPSDEKIYEADGFYLRAAAVCVKDDSESEVLLVTSTAHPERWIIPGGKIKPNEAPDRSAMREANEEGGVIGQIGRCLGSFDNLDRGHRTQVFVLRVSQLVDDFDDKDRRHRRWFSVDEAQKRLVPHKPYHFKYLMALKASRSSCDGDAAQLAHE